MVFIHFAKDFKGFPIGIHGVSIDFTSMVFMHFARGTPCDFTSVVLIHFARGTHCDFIGFHYILQGLLLKLALDFHMLCKGDPSGIDRVSIYFANGHPLGFTSMIFIYVARDTP